MTSQAKVLLSGLGADEQLGGYGRHASAFQSSSWPGLIQEIQLDLNRICNRNLGRDDRVISDHGKEVRFPFLDEDVTVFLSLLPIHYKMDLRMPKGVGDKLFLRNFCQQRLGLEEVASEPKRAIQFGARTAKIENSDKGHVALR
jgi:asparagine synthetase B (glutamine-hydrolysing)